MREQKQEAGAVSTRSRFAPVYDSEGGTLIASIVPEEIVALVPIGPGETNVILRSGKEIYLAEDIEYLTR